MLNVRISQDILVNIVREMFEKSKPRIDLIKRMTKESAVVSFNELGYYYTNGKLNWPWIVQTAYLTLVLRGAGRGAKVLEERFGDSLLNMVAMTDRHSAYFAIGFLDNLVCLAGIPARNLEYLNDIDMTQTWAKEVQALLRETVHRRNENRDAVIPK